MEEAGLELIVASGFEGGGHRGSFLRAAADSLIGGLSLIPQVVDAVECPVIAAGGIADGRGLVAAIALGAEAVQIGTAFLTCAGAGASDTYKTALRSKSESQTGLTDALTGRLARALRNRLMDELTSMGGPGPFPLQHSLVQTVARAAATQGRADLMTCWAGQSASMSQYTDPADFVAELVSEGDEFFTRL